MKNAPVPVGMVTAFFLGIVVKKECIVNAFNILSTPIRQTNHALPLVKFKNILDFKDTYFGFVVQFVKKYKKRKATLTDCLSIFETRTAFQVLIYCMTVTRFTVTPFSV